LFLATLCYGSACTAQQSIRIRVVDGRTGKPIASNALTIDAGTDSGWYGEDFHTSADGIYDVVLRNDQVPFAVYDSAHYRCDSIKENDPKALYNLRNVLNYGAVSANVCGNAHAQPVKGEILIYVRPAHFWERIRDALGHFACG